MSKRKTALSVLLVSAAVCVMANTAPSDRLVNVGTHHLQMRVEGEGTPVVVIDGGLGDQMVKLQPLQDSLARFTCVVAYNRAGYGQSEPGPLPRDAAREADELHTLLQEAKLPGPYVLVGHSLGALNAQVFAARYPDDAAAMVLMDPPPAGFILGREYGDLREMAEQMTAQWQAIADSTPETADPAQQANAAFLRMIASEHREMFGMSAHEADSIATFGDKPLVVMASGRPNPAFGDVAEAFQKFWVEQSRALAGKSTGGKFVPVEESSHFLYLDAPDVVAQDIISLVEAARAK